ncbi:MAG: hypothetical protein HQM02_05950, partial [Magnetococcales bacterium]|nr:hypothetical protein [Magnetococcales bacterium]
FLQGVANQLEKTITDSREMQHSTALILEPILEGLRQEGERLLENGDTAMRQTLNAVNQFQQQMEQTFQSSMESLGARLTANQREFGEQLVASLGSLTLPVAPAPVSAPIEPVLQEVSQRMERAAKAMENLALAPPQPLPPVTVEAKPSALPPVSVEAKPSALPPVTVEAKPCAPPSSPDPREVELQEMLRALKEQFPRLMNLDTTQIVKEAIDRLNALLGHANLPKEIEAYPALLALRQEVARILQSGATGLVDPASGGLPGRIAALIQSWEGVLAAPPVEQGEEKTAVLPQKPAGTLAQEAVVTRQPVVAQSQPPKPVGTRPAPRPATPFVAAMPTEAVQKSHPVPIQPAVSQNQPQKPTGTTPISRPEVSSVAMLHSAAQSRKSHPVAKQTAELSAGHPQTVHVSTPLPRPVAPFVSALPTMQELQKTVVNVQDFLPVVDRYLRKRQRPPFYLVKAVWSSLASSNFKGPAESKG